MSNLKLITLEASPFKSPFEVVFGQVIKLHIPSSENNVTIQINSGVEDYEENNKTDSPEARQSITTKNTTDTIQIMLDLNNNKKQTVKLNNGTYLIELLKISTVEYDNQNFKTYELSVTKS